MIEAAVLATGLLLVLTALASARIPGGALFAPPGIDASGAEPVHGASGATVALSALARRGRRALRAFLVSPIHPATWYANGALLLGPFVAFTGFAIIASLVSLGLTTIVAGIGIVFIALAFEVSRIVARVERWRAFVGEPSRPSAHPYRSYGGGWQAVLRAAFADESRWRDVLYVALALPLAFLEATIAALAWSGTLLLVTSGLWFDAGGLAAAPSLGVLGGHEPAAIVVRTLLGLALLPIAASLSQLLHALHRALVAALLCTSESGELRRQVQTLRESRSAALDVEASELRRIERDLHDGAQQRLVMLTIDLGLAQERIDTDPEAAKHLVAEAQVQAREALAEIRSLVRGIAPSILLDRGLEAAVASIAGRGPVPTALRSDLPPGERFSPAVERAAYFVVTEALANVAKHSGATSSEVRLRRAADDLVLEVMDDGLGGAHVGPQGGLAGLAGRVAAVDGTFTVSSPPGGPTVVRATIPLTPETSVLPGWPTLQEPR